MFVARCVLVAVCVRLAVRVRIHMSVRVFVIMVVRLCMRVFLLRLILTRDVELDCGNRAALHPLGGNMQAGELEFIQLLLQTVQVQTEVQQGAEQHIAGDAGERIQVQDFGFWILDFRFFVRHCLRLSYRQFKIQNRQIM